MKQPLERHWEKYSNRKHTQLWKIKHNLNKYCSVSVVDSAGNVVVGDVNYIDKGNIEISFSAAFAGKAYLN